MMSPKEKQQAMSWMVAQEDDFGVKVTLDGRIVAALDESRREFAEGLGFIPTRSYVLSMWIQEYVKLNEQSKFQDIIQETWKGEGL